MKNKGKQVKYTIGVSCVLVVLYIFVFFYYTGTAQISHAIADWVSYTQVIFTVLGLGGSIINIYVLYILNESIIESNEKNISQSKKIEDKNILYKEFYSEWNKAYRNFQESINGNQASFDCLYEVYNVFLNNAKRIDPNIMKIESVVWWTNQFQDVNEYYRTHPSFDANKASIEWYKKETELMDDISSWVYS